MYVRVPYDNNGAEVNENVPRTLWGIYNLKVSLFGCQRDVGTSPQKNKKTQNGLFSTIVIILGMNCFRRKLN